jgi:hypothetical protein
MVRGFSLLAAILLATFFAYQPSLNGELTNLDDNLYISESPYIAPLDWRNVREIFSHFHVGNYHPLAMISLSVDYAAGALKPRPYHRTNLTFHLLNTALCFWLVLALASGQPTADGGKANYTHGLEMAAISTLLFGLHTLHVESVAWVSERKDVLYTCWYLSALIAYVAYVRNLRTRRAPLLLLLTMVLFVLSLLSKGQAVALPLSLLAIDYLLHRPGRDKALILEKAPFFALSLVFGVVAILAQQSVQSVSSGAPWALWHRLIFASYAYIGYLWKLLVPLDLSVLYPYPPYRGGLLPAGYFGYPLLLVLFVAGCVALNRRSRMATFGILFYTVDQGFVGFDGSDAAPQFTLFMKRDKTAPLLL